MQCHNGVWGIRRLERRSEGSKERGVRGAENRGGGYLGRKEIGKGLRGSRNQRVREVLEWGSRDQREGVGGAGISRESELNSRLALAGITPLLFTQQCAVLLSGVRACRRVCLGAREERSRSLGFVGRRVQSGDVSAGILHLN